MAAPSMVSRDGENTIVKSVEAVFGASEEEDGEDEDGQEGQGSDEEEANSSFEGGSQDGSGSGDDREMTKLPQCKIKRNYICSLCDFFTQNPRFYLYHRKQVHKEKFKIFECPHCLYASKHSQKLQRHVHMVHVVGKKRHPKNRSRLMKKAAKMRRFLPLPAPSEAQPPPELSSPLAAMEDTNDESYHENPEDEDEGHDKSMEPMFGVDGSQVYKCSVCDMLSKSKALIAKHERVVHLKKRIFRCSKCNYMTHIKARYTKHVKYHSMPMIKCDMCDFKTPYKWNLDRHNKNHMGDGAFKCGVCNFAADIKQSLTVHEMNHHVPPVGNYYVGPKRPLRVGASDTMGMVTEEDCIDDDELQLLRLEREGAMDHMEQNPADFLQTQLEEPPSPTNLSIPTSPSSSPSVTVPSYSSRGPAAVTTANSNQLVTFTMKQVLRPAVVGRVSNGGLSSGGFIQLQKYKCKSCDFHGNLGEVQRHESSVHGFNDLQALEAMKQQQQRASSKRPIPNLIPIQGQSVLKPASERSLPGDQASSSANSSVSGSKSNSPTPPDDKKRFEENFKRKNASFFDKLKDRLAAERDLTCVICGYEAKCLSEQIMHRRTHSEYSEDEGGSVHQSGELSSTRCQHCRHRCKTSADLVVHLKTCPAVLSSSFETTITIKEEPHDRDEINYKDPSTSEMKQNSHPMENRIFVWNDFGQNAEPKNSGFRMNFYQQREELESPTTPPQQSSSNQSPNPNGVRLELSSHSSENTRKVFKCPSCSFWASTASRFHVHIVGHLNKRPFQCSLCQYSSNWRWDITKHIRLKQMRDSAHEKARVLLTDEAGRRNYSKYNKYIVPIPIEEFRKAQVPRKSPYPKENSDPLARKLKRPLEDSSEGDNERAKKKPFSENKKTMWKCKKCLFRNSDRAVVLAHVKDHYRSVSDLRTLQLSKNQNEMKKDDGGGNNQKEKSSNKHEKEEEETDCKPPPLDSKEKIEKTEYWCETCPYLCDSSEKLEEHAELHFVTHGASHKCMICPFYGENEKQLVEHLELHKAIKYSDSELRSMFSCELCPYVGTCQEQFTYHAKWHNKDHDHKCTKCDYSTHTNITLSLHVRLHRRGTSSAAPKQPKKPIFLADISGTDTTTLREIPMVWVSKPMGISKLFKCRFCPHVNMRKANIQDHEKMHSPKEQNTPSPGRLSCPHCNFISNNASVLSGHSKIHQSLNGQICGIVDFKKTDEEQIEEVKKKMIEYEKHITEVEEEPTPEEEEEDPEFKEPLILHFCAVCPARFLFKKEISNHDRFHNLHFPFKCESCTYSAREKEHLMAHMKVHTDAYKERTTALCNKYPINPDYPKPKVVVVLGEPHETSYNWKNESVWVVMGEESSRTDDSKENETVDSLYDSLKEPRKQKVLVCTKCPAEFSKDVALTYHMSLHGGHGPHKCKYCDYAVKTYGNLVRHEAVHTKNQSPSKLKLKAAAILNMKKCEVPVSGTDLFKQKSETEKGSPQKIEAHKVTTQKSFSSSHLEDPEFGTLIFGNPDFVYPTYSRNGKLRNKRYKCHKCPTAFEKREQYKIHIALHGSKHRFKCTKCDYSVKHYGSFAQHMRRHGHKMDETEKQNKEEGEESQDEPHLSSRCGKTLKMSVSDQQTAMIMQARSISSNKDNIHAESVNRCPHCPYANNRKDGANNHIRCHIGSKYSSTKCKYCDFSVPQKLNMREHTKVHFSNIKYCKPEAFLKCSRLEIWAEPVDSNHNSEKTLIFKDSELENEDRFFPKIEKHEDFENVKGRVYINLKTGEEEVEMDDDANENLENGFQQNGNGEKMEIDDGVEDKKQGSEVCKEEAKVKEEVKDADESSCDSVGSHGSKASNASSLSHNSHDG